MKHPSQSHSAPARAHSMDAGSRDELLRVARCPMTHSALSRAEQSLIERLNAAAAKGRVRSRDEELVEPVLEGGLVNEDRSLLYPVIGGILRMLPEGAIVLAQLDDASFLRESHEREKHFPEDH